MAVSRPEHPTGISCSGVCFVPQIFCDETVLVGHDIFHVQTPVTWTNGKEGELTFTRSNRADFNRDVQTTINYSVQIVPKNYGCELKLTIRNTGPMTLHNVVGHICLGHLSEQFRDPHHNRTYFRQAGSFVNLADTDRGLDSIRAHYRVKGGKPIKIFDNINNRFWGGLSYEIADDGLIVTQAVDADRIVALWFDPACELFQNSDEPNMCIHSDPVFGDLQSGQSIPVTGKLILFEGSLDEFSKIEFK